MFGLYFGRYLVEKNRISQTQFETIMQQQQKARVKLGLIAVSEKLLTGKQADEINDIQRKMDRRFGDIAIEKGYLLAEEVTYLLNMQGNPYLQFVQVCTENNILTIQEIETNLEQFKNDSDFSTADLDAIKSGDIDRIIPVFVDMNLAFTSECIVLTIRNIVRFINSNIILKKAYKVHDYTFEALASQKVIGEHDIFVGLASKGNALLTVANPFAKEEFTMMDADAFDSVCEFINCSNGLYASKLSQDNIEIDMTPPLFYTEKKLSSKGDMYVVPVIIDGKQVDIIVAVDNQVELNERNDKMAKVLLVDDSRTSRKILRSILEENGHEVIGEAENGSDGIRQYKELKPDITTMDITMPVMDGLEALKQIMEYNKDAKVIMVTAAGQKTKMVDAIKYGAAEFIAKPFENQQIITIIDKVMQE